MTVMKKYFQRHDTLHQHILRTERDENPLFTTIKGHKVDVRKAIYKHYYNALLKDNLEPPISIESTTKANRCTKG